MNVLIIDGMNILHRARSGFQLGEYNVVFNFFRSLKSLVEKFKPNRAYFTLEGHPKKRYALLPEYKANRIVDESDTKKLEQLKNFYRQKDVIIDLMSKHLPLSIVRHPDYEADDVIYNIVKNGSHAVQYTIVSSDTDYVQMLQEFDNVKLYNPVTKAFVEAPDYDYITWKSLRGDPTDNVPGLVTEGKALTLVNDETALADFFKQPGNADAFTRNVDLIRFAAWDDTEMMGLTSSAPTRDWDVVKSAFTTWQFKSMLTDKYWGAFINVFDGLFG